MRVMVLQVKDRTTTSSKTNKDRLREDKIKEDRIREDKMKEDRIREEKIKVDRIREQLLVILIHLQPPDQISRDSCHHLKITNL